MTRQASGAAAPCGASKQVIYAVDDDAGVRLSLSFMLDTLGYQSWPFASGVDFLEALPTLSPGCVLLDVRMPGMDGLQIMAELDRRDCRWPVIVMTGHGEIPIAVQAMKLGAIEFIEKPFGEEVMRTALDRGFTMLQGTQRRVAHRRAAEQRLAMLSPREEAVLRELVGGGQNKAVAHRLNLSVRTIEMHRANLLGKLGVRTLQEATSLVLQAQSVTAG